MKENNEETIRKIVDEEISKRVKPKKAVTRGDPVCNIEY